MHDTRTIDVKENILGENDRIAERVNHELTHRNIFVVNEMGAPGVGKTSVLLRLTERLKGFRPFVIEGDIESDLDTQTLRGLGVPAFQINTFGACHLDAPQVWNAVQNIGFGDGGGDGSGNSGVGDGGGVDGSGNSGVDEGSNSGVDGGDKGRAILFIENVGNLVCPAEFRIGEHMKLLVCSVTEGSDKPYKYPLAFREADMILLNKIDLCPYIDFDEEFFMKGLRAQNKDVPVIRVSGKTGEGFDEAARMLEHMAGHALENHAAGGHHCP
jgi:hydrogenase nickel incorporation protein HypB